MEMQKPYDGQALVAALKKEGIEEGVKVASTVVKTAADWLRSSMKLSKDGIVGHLDDLAIPVVDSFEKMLLSKLDALSVEVAPAPAAEPAPASEAPPSA